MPERKGHFAPQNNFLDTIARRFDGTHSNFLLGNALSLETFPIVYCSDGFCELTGFHRAQLMQMSCSCPFLYGKDTNPDSKRKIEIALKEKKEFKGKLILYKKNHEPFHCFLDIVPIKDDKDEVVLFLISHKNIPMPENNDSLNNSLISLNSNFSTASNNSSDLQRRESFKQLGRRRRSRAVLYTLSENLEGKKSKDDCFPSFTNCLLAQRNTSPPQYKPADKRTSCLTILHFGTAKTIWDWLVMAVTIYVISVVPYYAALQSVEIMDTNSTESKVGHHNADTHGNTATLVFDISVEVVFILDIILTFRTTFVNKSGWVVSNAKQIAMNYLKTWFFIDVIAAIPIDILSHLFDLGDITQPLALLKTVRLLRLLRLYHRIDRWTQYSAVLLFMLMLMFGLLAHWLACVWFIIGWSEVHAVTGVGWLFELSEAINAPFYSNGTGGPDIDSAYITSLYFTLSSLTSVGFGNVSGNTNKEKIFSICVMIIGALMHAVVFGNVTAIIQRMYAKRSQYDIKVRDLKDFIKVHRISKETKGQMISHFQNTWQANGGVNAKKVLRDFPKDIQIEVAVQIYKEALSLPAFLNGPKGFSRLLSLHIHRRRVGPDDYLIYAGDPLLSVIFVCKGALEVVKNGLCIGMLGKGDILGADVGGPRHQPMISQADVKATYPCELECISISGITEVMDVYPEYAETFIEHMRSDFSFNLWQSVSNSQVFDSHSMDENISIKMDSKKWSASESELSRQHENNTSFLSDDLNISPDEIKLNTKYESDEDLSNVNESSSLFAPTAHSEFSTFPEKTYFAMKYDDRQKAHKNDEAALYGMVHIRNETDKTDVVFDKADFVTSTPSLTRSNAVNENQQTSFENPLEVDTLTLDGKPERSNKITSLVNSLLSVFSGKSNSDSDDNLRSVSCDNSMELAVRPSCFKKSLMTLPSPSLHNRLESPSSDASSVIKRVTFSDDPGVGSTSLQGRSKRSLSIPGEETKNLSLGFNGTARRHSDADLPSSTFSMGANLKSVVRNGGIKGTDCNPTNRPKKNRDDSITFSDIYNRFPANNSDCSSELSATKSSNHPSGHVSRWRSNSDTCPKVTLPLLKGDFGSPQKGNPRRKRRQRRKSNSPNSFSQLHNRRKMKYDDGDIASDSRISIDSREDLNLSGSDSQLKNEDGSISSQLSFSESERMTFHPDSYFLDRLQSINSKLFTLQTEIHHLVAEVRESRVAPSPVLTNRTEVDLNSPNSSSTNFTCQPPSPKMACQRQGPATAGVKTLSHPHNSDDVAVQKNNGSVFKQVCSTMGNNVSDKGAFTSLPTCVVTSPTGETDDVIIDYDKLVLKAKEVKLSDLNSSNVGCCDPTLASDLNIKQVPVNSINETTHQEKNRACATKEEEDYSQRYLRNSVPFNGLRRFSSSSSLGSIASFTAVNPSPLPKQSFQEETYYTPTGTPPENQRHNHNPTSVFIPIRNVIESPPMSDIDSNYRNSLGLTRHGSVRRGTESGYISTSPTMQLREYF